MASAHEDRFSKCLWAALSVHYFQKENLVITIKRPYYTADFLEKSVFYWAGPQTHTHTLLATTHRNRSEQGLAWEETEKGSGSTNSGVKECVYMCVCVMNTHSAWPGEAAGGVQRQVKKGI